MDINCGCWYQIFDADFRTEETEKPATWKRELKQLGYASRIRHQRQFSNELPWDHPNNRYMTVEIANLNNICPQNHQ